MLVSAVWIAPAVLATLSRVAQQGLHGEPPPTLQDLIWTGGDWLVYAVLTPPIFAAARRWPIVRPHIARRALLHLGFSLLFCVGWAVAGKVLQLTLRLLLSPQEVHDFAKQAGDRFWTMLGVDLLSWIFTTLPFGVVVYVSLVGIAHAIQSFVESSEREVQMSRMSEQLTGAKLAALQAQLNPHFLFNSLNTIAVLVRDGDRVGATRVIEQLSDVLRSTLNRTQTAEVALEDELGLVRGTGRRAGAFLDRLRPVLDIDGATLRAAVPRFALQHLVENALARRRQTHRSRSCGDHRTPRSGRPHPHRRRRWPRAGDGRCILGKATGSTTPASACGRFTLTGLRSPSAPAREGTIAELRVPYREIETKAEPRGNQ